MRVRGGHTVEVFRASVDRFGDGELVSIGTIDNVVFQWASAASVGLRFHTDKDFQETSSLSAVMFIPRDAAVSPQSRDRIKFNGELYQVVGEHAWDENHPVTDHDFGYYMLQVEVTS